MLGMHAGAQHLRCTFIVLLGKVVVGDDRAGLRGGQESHSHTIALCCYMNIQL